VHVFGAVQVPFTQPLLQIGVWHAAPVYPAGHGTQKLAPAVEDHVPALQLMHAACEVAKILAL